MSNRQTLAICRRLATAGVVAASIGLATTGVSADDGLPLVVIRFKETFNDSVAKSADQFIMRWRKSDAGIVSVRIVSVSDPSTYDIAKLHVGPLTPAKHGLVCGVVASRDQLYGAAFTLRVDGETATMTQVGLRSIRDVSKRLRGRYSASGVLALAQFRSACPAGEIKAIVPLSFAPSGAWAGAAKLQILFQTATNRPEVAISPAGGEPVAVQSCRGVHLDAVSHICEFSLAELGSGEREMRAKVYLDGGGKPISKSFPIHLP